MASRQPILLITGGTGTLGTALVDYALTHHPTLRLIVLSRGEHRQADLRRRFPSPRLDLWIGDVRDRDRLMWAMRVRPDVVIHAAALKRVEVCAAHPHEAAKTNIDGTRHVVETAMLAGVPKVLMVSSDKACSPATTYGATKAAAEALAIGQNAYRGSGPTRISVVRYGNVLGSQGSVLNVISEARATGTMPITDPQATRFWWDIARAVEYIDQVLGRMQGGEIWVPKLPAATVTELTEALAPDAQHEVVGMRGAEKRHEYMISESEASHTWDVGDGYLILPHHGAWWSPPPPPGAVKVPEGFCYSSLDACQGVHFEPAGAL